MDHYCKLSESIVAVCQLYDGEGADAKLAQIEFIITENQYDQLPDKEKPSWHNHAVELTPQRGAPEFVDLPPGVNGTELLSTLQTTYGKVITVWEPNEELPQSEPYAFWVDLGETLLSRLCITYARPSILDAALSLKFPYLSVRDIHLRHFLYKAQNLPVTTSGNSRESF